MDCVLALNGTCKRELLLEALESRENALIIGVDGGTKHILNLGMKPDIVIGDMDSLSEDVDVEKLVFPEDKYEIDAELALDECFRRGGKRVYVLCWRGERVDMEYALLLLLKKYGSLKVVLLEDGLEVVYVEGKAELEAKPGEKWSILPLGGSALVTLKGFKYEIDRWEMPPEKPYGVSNVALKEKVFIQTWDGGVVAIRWKKKPS